MDVQQPTGTTLQSSSFMPVPYCHPSKHQQFYCHLLVFWVDVRGYRKCMANIQKGNRNLTFQPK
uniref:Uncharacterized protein n=1 Tax=Arundo donax TaxID=35708 RepID=A0A0A9GYX0_ARUDO